MASILLKRDYTQTRGAVVTHHKAGAVVSVPFDEGAEMVRAGVGVRWNGGVGHEPPAAPAPTPAPAKPKSTKQPAEAKAAEAKSGKGD